MLTFHRPSAAVRRTLLAGAAVLALVGVGAAWVMGDQAEAEVVSPLATEPRPTPEPSSEPVAMCVETPLADMNLPTAIDANFLAQVNYCFLPAAAVYGYDLRVTSGFRTVAEQNLLYEQGRTEDGHVITEVRGGRSVHNFGFAVDVADERRGYRINWDRLGRIAAYCGLEQNEEGDQAHFAHRAGLTIEQFQAGQRPPTLVLPCANMDDRALAGEPLTRQDLQDCGAPEF